MDSATIRVIVEIALLLLTAFLGKKWKGAKNTAKNGVAVAQATTNHVLNLANAILDAVQDDKVSPEEEKEIATNIRVLLGRAE